MRCPECGASGYSRETKSPEWRCSKCGHEWDVAPAAPSTDRFGGQTPVLRTRFTYRGEILRIFNFFGSFVVFAVAPVLLFFLGTYLFGLILLTAGWYPSQQPAGENAPVVYYVVQTIRVVITIGLAVFVARRVHASLDRRIEAMEMRGT